MYRQAIPSEAAVPVVWTSSEPSVANVNKNGRVTANMTGTANTMINGHVV